MRWPKLRELKEAVNAVVSPRFTTRFPAEPCVVPERFRGKPEFDLDTCIGCGACVNVCPAASCLTMVDALDADPPVRRITHRYDCCIFCGNCQDYCTTQTGIALSDKWDLAVLNRGDTVETHEYELQMCEKCGAKIGTKKHIIWLCEKLGPLAYTNPSLLLAKSGELTRTPPKPDSSAPSGPQARDFMRILCPKCKCELNIKL